MAHRGRNHRQQDPALAEGERLQNASMISLINELDASEGQDIGQFFRQARQIRDIAFWSPRQFAVLLKTKFRGRVLEFLNNSPELQEAINDDVIENLIRERFQTTTTLTQCQLDFQRLRHRPGQSVEELSEVIDRAARKFLGEEHANTEVMDHIKQSKLVEIIRPDIKKELLKYDLQNFRDGINKARQIENYLNYYNINILFYF